jgi:O-antigen/teichoic acid export membrane protein
MSIFDRVRPILQKDFSKDVIYNLISTVILGVSGVLLNTIVGNHYGPTGLGVFNQA